MTTIRERLACWWRGHDYGRGVIDGYTLRSTCQRCGDVREAPADPTLGRRCPNDVDPRHWPEKEDLP